MNDRTPPDWGTIRDEYEDRLFLPKVICRRHGISVAQLRYRREKEGWLSARARVPKQHDIVARLLRVLEKQVTRLEAAVDEPIDKQVKALAASAEKKKRVPSQCCGTVDVNANCLIHVPFSKAPLV